MIVQWCCKGMAKLPEREAERILTGGTGIRCRSWLTVAPKPFPLGKNLDRLTEDNLDRHVNKYSDPDPVTGAPFHDVTPFISLSAGCVDRQVAIERNETHSALRTALTFATTDYSQPGPNWPRCAGWVFYCYVLTGVNRAVSIPSVAEEYRELNLGRSYSRWQPQGEVMAKINVPSRQILCAVHWTPLPSGESKWDEVLWNLRFTHPAALLGERNML
ncbi:hypothetical protein [Amycolatopsis mediterranei]|uniref:Uncharacterized protein n=1 Tax=Amycolatopsis mediterranei (strain S699) TaxID=713604 RepID=A0A9R0UB74_AMYMS|nr:hypothetical protein [Amycolatopsis mediterranei]AEK44413.1 hypothetical protein RAM_29690 [Amycolatopsis mediterranei S699]KDO12835.1 hypothetical protein DV26_00155 [Amycolatopsis mediterranei]KDU88608.1 hypothetical protein DV36_28720 [Amycolatopsis mediterranei]UZF72550.1 hypothetical protein ISP_005918 [Amycolatopsis mediterranei]